MWDSKIASCKPGMRGELCTNINKHECEFEVRKVKYKHLFSSIKYIYQHEGIWAFSKGILPRMCINVPSTALSWGTYELLKSLLNKRARE